MSSDAVPASPAPVEGLAFGAYRLVREIGRGGMGVVYLAEVIGEDGGTADDISTKLGEVSLRPPPGSRVAVKTFHPHLVESKDFARRFRREARTGAAIHHPNVVRTYEAGAAKLRGVATSYLAMEYVEGQTLRDLIRELGRVPPTFAAALARQVAGGLAAIHAAGATHRDLKPENVIVARCAAPRRDDAAPQTDYVVKLMDLGVAKLREASIRLSMTGQFLGSVHYASPEQFRSPDAVDHRTDLYALGVLLHEMLAGENPFFHTDIRVVLRRTVSEMPRRLSLVAPDTPRHLDQLVWSLIQKDPEHRVQSAAEAADVLELGEESAWWTTTGGALWAQSGERLTRRMTVPRDARLAGREAELAELRRLFDLAAAGERQTLLLEGEAGVGKTRLLDEFAASLAEAGVAFDFVFGTTAPDGTGRPLHAFTEALLAGLDPHDTAGSLERLLPPGAPVAAFDGFLRGAPGAASLPQDQLRALFAAGLRALAAEKPLLVVIDDMHRASENSLNLLSYLARDDRSSRILLVAAFRTPGEGQPLHRLVHETRDANSRHMLLGRLSAREVGVLLRDLLRSEHVVQEIGFPLLEKTEGNPFFILEVIQSLQRDHVLTRRDDGAWTLAGTKVEIHVPDTVKDLLLANLARIPDEDRDLLDVAAVMGMEFDPDLLAEIVGVPKIALLKRLSQLERKHRLVRSAGRRCRFDHPHLQETLYLGLMQGLREEYHAQVAEHAERRAASGRAPEQVEAATAFEIARHFVHAGRVERAAAWIAPALRFAAQSYRVDEGVEVASRFLDAAEETGASVAPETRVDVLIALVGFHEHEGRREEERRRLDSAAAETAAVSDRRLLRRVRDLRLTFHFQVGDYAAAADACRAAMEESVAAGDREGALAALGNLACALRSLGRFDEAAAHVERALAEFLPAESGVRRCLLLGSLGIVDLHRGRARAAQRRFLEARAVAVQFGIPEPGRFAPSGATADALREQFVGLSRALGRYAESRIDAERMLLLDTSLPRRLGEAAALLELGLLASQLQMTSEARGCLLGSLAAARDAADARFEAAVLHALGENALQAEDLDMARRDFAGALEIRRRIGYRPGTCESLLALGQLAAIRGELAEARPLLDEASELAPALQMPAIAALARASRALLLAREGRRDAARAELEQARIVLADAGPLSVSSRAEGLYFAALAARALGDEDAYGAHMQAAWRTIRAIADRLPPAEREAFLTGASPNREIAAAVAGGQRLGGTDERG